MRKFILVIMLFVLAPVFSNAAIGDTTWVQTFNDIWLDHNGNFDTTVNFPDGSVSYRKVYMIFTVGKYQCPGSPQYCGDWDYTVNTYLMNKNGDSVELGRLITPYANASYARFPWTWKQRYVFDVTDFYPLLKDSATCRINYSGYSWGFTGNIRFAFVEGTPARNVTGIHRLWHGYFGYGGSTSIESKVGQLTKTAPANTQFAELKFNVSGHGSDDAYCSEFCKKYYQVKLNSTQIDQQDIWRDNCGFNHLYPQSGTWIYDRGNWCPGDIVYTRNHKLNGVTANNNYDIDIDFEPYTASGPKAGQAGYGVDAAVVYYAGFNHTTDVSVEDIISPNMHEMHYRDNPVGDRGKFIVKNTGSATITSMNIEFGTSDGVMRQFTWTGSIAPLDTAIISTPEIPELRTNTNTSGVTTFTVKVLQVNGNNDEDNSNNTLHSYFKAAAKWPMTIIVNMRTNNVANETSWKILDAINNVVAQRDGVNANTTYIDTVKFGPGSYRLVVSDAGCDGLSFWANSSAGSGSLTVKGTVGIGIYNLQGYFSGDFGCGFTHWFNAYWPVSVENVNEYTKQMEVYPNPATDEVNVIFSNGNINGIVNLVDAMGRVVTQQVCRTANMKLNTAGIAAGVYNVVYRSNDGITLQSRLVITN